jgi:hypothetical protein
MLSDAHYLPMSPLEGVERHRVEEAPALLGHGRQPRARRGRRGQEVVAAVRRHELVALRLAQLASEDVQALRARDQRDLEEDDVVDCTQVKLDLRRYA